MENIESIKSRIEQALPGSQTRIITNPSPAAQDSLLLDHEHALAVACFLRDDPHLALDYLSNVTGVDWPEPPPEGATSGSQAPITSDHASVPEGFLEAVYHLYSVKHRQGPVVLRLRTTNRTDLVELPSLTPAWRGAELQEREIFDLFGIRFKGHPDLRRLLMWDEFEDHPMRRDYVSPDDFEYEPTPHDDVRERAHAHHLPDRPPAASP